MPSHNRSKLRERSREAVGLRTSLSLQMCVNPLRENTDKWSGPFGSRVHFMSSSVFFYLCVFQREKEPCGWSGPRREQPHHSSTEKVSRPEDGATVSGRRPQHTSQSQHRHHKPVIHNAQSPGRHHRTKKKRKAKRYWTKGGKAWRTTAVSPPLPLPPHLAPPILSSQQETPTVRHGRSDCGLVEAVSVSGRGNALINPVRVKDTGACKADPGFVLHCLCFRVTATTYIGKENKKREKRAKKKTDVRRLVKVQQLNSEESINLKSSKILHTSRWVKGQQVRLFESNQRTVLRLIMSWPCRPLSHMCCFLFEETLLAPPPLSS